MEISDIILKLLDVRESQGDIEVINIKTYDEHIVISYCDSNGSLRELTCCASSKTPYIQAANPEINRMNRIGVKLDALLKDARISAFNEIIANKDK